MSPERAKWPLSRSLLKSVNPLLLLWSFPDLEAFDRPLSRTVFASLGLSCCRWCSELRVPSRVLLKQNTRNAIFNSSRHKLAGGLVRLCGRSGTCPGWGGCVCVCTFLFFQVLILFLCSVQHPSVPAVGTTFKHPPVYDLLWWRAVMQILQ